jgi:hypothetical protein
VGVDLGALVVKAIATAKRTGVAGEVTLTRPAPAPNPLTGVASGSSSTQTVDATQASPRRSVLVSDSAWTTARVVLLVPAASLTFTPLTGDLATFGGATGRVTATDSIAPAGTPVAWFIAVGA